MDEQLSLTIADQTIESPAYEDIVGSIYDGGEWIYEQIRDVVIGSFR